MKNKRRILLFILFTAVGVSILVYFITRLLKQEEILPQKFAQLPQKPKVIDEFHQNTKIYAVAFSPVDSSIVAFVDEHGTIKLWRRNITNKPAQILEDIPERFHYIDFSPSGKLLASSSYRKLILWDVASGTKLNSIEPATRQFAFTPDGEQLATVSNEIKLWDISNPKKIVEIATLPYDETHKAPGWASAVAISNDGTLLAEGYSHGTINVWYLKTRQFVKSLETPLSEMRFLKFSPDNKYLTAVGHEVYTDGNNKRWKSKSARKYFMWELPNWQRKGQVLRGNVESLVFSPDTSLCASATGWAMYGRGVEIWSTTNGTPIATIPTEGRDVAFSHDGELIVTGGNDGIVRVWKLAQPHLDSTNDQNDLVRLIYNLPKGIEPSYNITQKIDQTIREVQKFYADEMERHGFGRKTFRFETDENGKAKIYQMEEYLAENHDLQLNDIWLVFADDMNDTTYYLIDQILEQNTLGENRYLSNSFDSTFTFPTKRNVIEKDKIWMDDIEGIAGDGRFISISKKKIDWKLTAYSLKRLFGLLDTENSWDKIGPNMSNSVLNSLNRLLPWSKEWVRLSKCEAEFLDKSRYFNSNRHFFDNQPDIEMSILKADTESQLFQFTASDEDGIHQMLLFVPDNLENQYRIDNFQGCESINGKKRAIVEFEVFNPGIKRGEIRMIDMLGNIASRKFHIEQQTSQEEEK